MSDLRAWSAGRRFEAAGRSLEAVGLVGLLTLAAALRLPNLATRGTWDADQGHDMLVLHAFVTAGEVPLLGPPTSIGDFHHGALYYLLLAPVAALGGSEPTFVVAAIAVAGIAAVAVTWWLARAIAGPLAGAVAAGLMAVSAAAIDEATFIWNPNLIPLSSAVALAAAWRAWSSRRPAWWVVAAIGVGATMQFHVLGVAFLPPMAAFLVADALRRSGPDRRRVAAWGAAGVAAIVLGYLPLVVHELTHGFAETRAALEYLSGGGEPVAIDPVTRLLVVAFRSLSWPLTGLLIDGLAAGVAAATALVAIAAWRLRAAGPGSTEGVAVRWLAGTLAASILALAVGASSLATFVRGLPNDHYHAFLDPVVFVLVGIGATRVLQLGRAGAMVVTAGLTALVLWNIAHLPPPVARDGGWPAARLAGQRILEAAQGRSVTLLGAPDFKSTDAYGFPLVRLGRPPVDAGAAELAVVVCDELFSGVLELDCGVGAEEARLAEAGFSGARSTDRFEAAPGRWISVWGVGPP